MERNELLQIYRRVFCDRLDSLLDNEKHLNALVDDVAAFIKDGTVKGIVKLLKKFDYNCADKKHKLYKPGDPEIYAKRILKLVEEGIEAKLDYVDMGCVQCEEMHEKQILDKIRFCGNGK